MTNVFSKINKNETMLETYKKNEKKKIIIITFT